MRKAITFAVGLGFVSVAVMALEQARGQQAPEPPPSPDSQYRLGPDSLPQEGVPRGEIRGPFTLASRAYPGTQHTYWVYVPAHTTRPSRRPSWSSRTARRSRTRRGTCGRRT